MSLLLKEEEEDGMSWQTTMRRVFALVAGSGESSRPEGDLSAGCKCKHYTSEIPLV